MFGDPVVTERKFRAAKSKIPAKSWCRKRDTTPRPRKPNNHGLFSGPVSPPLDLTLWTLRKATPSAAGGEATGTASG
jgi:hypothetical protein